MEKQLKNPWTDLTKGEVQIAERDIPFFEEWAKKNHVEGNIDEIVKAYAEKINAKTWINEKTGKPENVELTFDYLPDPFCGDPDSKVYCLNLNPGKPDAKFKGIDAYTKATKENLRLKSKNCFWSEGILNAEGSEHAGADWTRKRTEEIKKILNEGNSGKELIIPNIFFIEYFPYHSTNCRFNFPRKKLMEKVTVKNANGKKEVVKDDKGNIKWQHREKKSEENSYPASYDFSDHLIEQAMKDNKMIIIMRAQGDWLERIEGLADYEHLYVLSSPECGYLTLRNIMNHKTGKRLEDEKNYKEIIKKYFKI